MLIVCTATWVPVVCDCVYLLQIMKLHQAHALTHFPVLQIMKSQRAHAPTHFDVFVADREVTESSCAHPF
jgi:hypothetical protein